MWRLPLTPTLPASGASERTALAALTQHRLAVLDHGDVARFHRGFERSHVSVVPHLRRHGLAGIDWRAAQRYLLPQRAHLILGIGLPHSAQGQAVGAHA